MTSISRRAFLGTSALTAAGLGLAGCGAVTSTTTNGVTTININVAQFDSWFTAFDNGANLILGLTGISATPTGAAIVAVGAMLAADLKAFDTATKGQTTLTFDSTAIPAAVQSLLTDGSTLLADAQAAVTGVAATDVATAQNYLNALETIWSLVQAQFGSLMVGAPLRAAPRMSEAQALAVLRVK